MGPRITLPSHGFCCPSRRHALQEISQYAQQSEALEPSDTDDDLAPDTRSISNPVTPTKPSSRENQTLANAPKKSQKLTRKFSESDLQDLTPSKRPRLSTRPSVASRSPEIATVEQAQSQSPLPTSLRPVPHSKGPTSRRTMQVEEGSRSQPDNNDNLKDSIEAGMERMEITPSLSSEDGKVRTHDAQDLSEAETDGMKTTPSLASEDEEMRTYDAEDSSEADTDQNEPTPSLGGEIFNFFGYDVIMY